MADHARAHAIRSNPLQLRPSNDLNPTRATSRAGKTANSARHKQVNTLSAEDLSARVHDLSALIQKIAMVLAATEAADQNISIISELVRSARALVGQAQQTTDVTIRAALADQFDALLPRLDQIAGEATVGGINLLAGNDLTITMSEDVSAVITVASFNDTAAGDLALNRSHNKWATNADTDIAAAELKLALVVLRSQAQTLRSSLSALRIRQDFTVAMVGALQTGIDNLTSAESRDERANLFALQARQQLPMAALLMAAQAGRNVLRLF